MFFSIFESLIFFVLKILSGISFQYLGVEKAVQTGQLLVDIFQNRMSFLLLKYWIALFKSS